jgi:hypothetical protein
MTRLDIHEMIRYAHLVFVEHNSAQNSDFSRWCDALCAYFTAVGCGVLFGRNILTVMATNGMRQISNPFGEDLAQEAEDMGAGQGISEETREQRAAIARALKQGGGFVGGKGLLHDM